VRTLKNNTSKFCSHNYPPKISTVYDPIGIGRKVGEGDGGVSYIQSLSRGEASGTNIEMLEQ